MNTIRWSIAGLALGVALAVAPSCGPQKARCNASNCLGCCDATGACQIGTELSACGEKGAACASCTAAQICKAGACAASDQCSAANCSGCCGPTGCESGTSPDACGAVGESCVTCGTGQHC